MPAPADCWNHIGALGDGTCATLKERIHCRNCPTYWEAGRSLLERMPPPGYRDEYTGLLAMPKQAGETALTSVVVFRLGGEWFAFKTKLLAQVAPMRRPHTLPLRSGGIIAGLVNVEGELVLCASLAGLLGVEPDAESVGARMIVLGEAGRRWAFAVDQVLGVRRIDDSAMEAMPDTLAGSAGVMGRGIFLAGDHRVALLDEQSVFNSLNRAAAG